MTDFSTPPPPPPFPRSVNPKPRPRVTVGSLLMIAGGVLMVAGSLLHWFDLDGATFNGFTDGLEGFTNVKGSILDVLGVLVLGGGIAQVVGRKVLALGVIGIAAGAVGLLVGLKALSDVQDVVDFGRMVGLDVSSGPGLYVAILGSFVGIGGSIVTVAKPRV